MLRFRFRILVLVSFLFLWILPETVLVTAEVSPTEVSPAEAERFGKEIRQHWVTEIPLDESALTQSGIRRLESQHLILYTDLAASGQVDELPKLFDQLIPLLCDYFELNRQNYESFKVEGFLIDDFEKFKSGGAVLQVPKLRNGYALRCRIWVRNPGSDYYRRHLLLHEGTHAFMGYAFGVWGPPWYREGTAELLGTHRLENGHLTLAYFPKSRNELSRWGRIDLVRDNLVKNHGRTIKGIFELDSEDYDENTAYGWSWAFAAFCENHPRYRTAFRQTAWKLYGKPDGAAERFLELLLKNIQKESPEWNEQEILFHLDNDWIDFISHLDYGYDFERTKIDYNKEAGLISSDEVEIPVCSDKGWQSSGVRLERGKTYRFAASGRFQLAEKPKIWWSEPNGITLRYYQSVPIGTLLATLIPDIEERFLTQTETAGVGFYVPKTIGLSETWKAEVSGELFFRINDFPSELSDNNGEATVKLTVLPVTD
ncbi:MAG: hypothetical protein LBQ50_02595 [Planctomycetaceae bacterium]|jgi:hypothetical protein|nr:hypothetical protein [Planctomycetaceae bacterium]